MTLIAKEPSTASAGLAAPPEHAEPPTPAAECGNAGQVWRLLIALALVTAVFLVAGLGDILLFIVIIVAIVMLHELGHFATAKWSGMKVTEYFVGFGPRLWSVRRGRDRIRGQGHPGRGLRPDHRLHRARRRGHRGRAAHLPPAAFLEADHRRVGRLGHAFPDRLRPRADQRARLRGGDEQRPDHFARALVRGGADPGAASRAPGGRHHRVGERPARCTTPTRSTTSSRSSVGKPVTLGVERDGQLASIVVTPQDGRGIKVGDVDPGAGQRQDAAGLHRDREGAGVAIGESAQRHRPCVHLSRFSDLGRVRGPGPRVLPERRELPLPPGDQFARCHPGG